MVAWAAGGGRVRRQWSDLAWLEETKHRMETVNVGSRAIPVKLAQRLLNKRGAEPVVSEGGVFDFRTDAALRAFQKSKGLPVTHMVEQNTWQQLGLQIEIAHDVDLIPEVPGLDCWEAAIAMLQRQVPPAIPPVQRTFDGGLVADPGNIWELANGLGWDAYQVDRWSLPEMVTLLKRGPIWAAGGGINLRERFPSGYVVVISGLWSDGDHDLSGTLLRFHNPRPTGTGAVYGRLYRGPAVNFDFMPGYFLVPGENAAAVTPADGRAPGETSGSTESS